jgi:hypothetical protein
VLDIAANCKARVVVRLVESMRKRASLTQLPAICTPLLAPNSLVLQRARRPRTLNVDAQPETGFEEVDRIITRSIGCGYPNRNQRNGFR